MKKGFTLSELLIALAIVGGLAGILTPIISRLIPNENVMRAKKAFHITAVTIQDMLNDETCYPDLSTLDRDDNSENPFKDYFKTVGGERVPRFTGLLDPHGYSGCKYWPDNEDAYDGDGKKIIADDQVNDMAGAKFVQVFMDKIGCYDEYNVAAGGEVTYPNVHDNDTDPFVCRTKDGMEWTFDVSDPVSEEVDPYIRIYVDVNGTESPNRKQPDTIVASEASDEDIEFWDFDYDDGNGHMYKVVNKDSAFARNSSFDTFRMDVDYKTGQITIQNEWVKDNIGPEADIMSND